MVQVAHNNNGKTAAILDDTVNTESGNGMAKEIQKSETAITRAQTTSTNEVRELYVDVVSLLRVILVNSWLIVLIAAAGTIATFLYVDQLPNIYQSSSSVVVLPRSDVARSQLEGIDVLDLNVVGTYVQILESRNVTESAYDALESDYDRVALEDAQVDIRPVSNSSIIRINIRSENRQLAMDLNTQLAFQTIEENPLESLRDLYPIAQLDAASEPEEPVAPNTTLSLVLGGAGSLVIGIALAFLLDAFVRYRKKQEDAPA